MDELANVTVAGDIAEAEELERILAEAGIEATLRSAVAEHPGGHADGPVQVLVPADAVDAARDAIEALTEPDELIDED